MHCMNCVLVFMKIHLSDIPLLTVDGNFGAKISNMERALEKKQSLTLDSGRHLPNDSSNSVSALTVFLKSSRLIFESPSTS